MKGLVLLIILICAVIIIQFRCGQGREKDVCPAPQPGPQVACPSRCVSSDIQAIIDNPGTETAAYARVITKAEDLLPGEPKLGGAREGRVNDYLIGNDKIRLIISNPVRAISLNPFGGTIIDASAIVGGKPTPDYWGSLTPFFNLALTQNTCSVEIVNDGANGAAIIAATGSDGVLDYLNIVTLPLLFGLFPLPYDPNADLPLAITTYYILRPGDNYAAVITSYCNTGSERIAFPAGDIIDTGGDIELFNPSYDKAFGVPPPDEILSRLSMNYLGFLGDEADYEGTSYAYVPEGNKNISITYAGITGTVNGTEDFTILLNGVNQSSPQPGVIDIEPGSAKSIKRYFVVSSGGISSLTDIIYSSAGLLRSGAVSTISGMVVESGTGNPVQDARISVLKMDGTVVKAVVTQFKTDDSGNFSGIVPAPESGITYTLSADAFEMPRSAGADIAGISSLPSTGNVLTLGQPALVNLRVTDSSGNYIPAKITFKCSIAPCPKTANENFGDVRFDPLPDGVETVAFIHPQKTYTVQVTTTGYRTSKDGNIVIAPGIYDIYVSRGMEYDRAELLSMSISAGINDLGAVSLHRVVDTSGYLSGDFHVHSVNSSDAPIPLIDRVMTFAGEGVEILVATDHDYITDYRPVIEELNLQEFVNSVIGNEVTTWDFGHFNAFPLTPDTSKPANGALDWGNGTGYTMTPCQIMDGMLDDPGEEIVQVNHPRGSAVFQAYFSAIQLDTLTRKTYATPEIFRMPPDLAKFIGWSPLAKDTGLFYGKFTAMEIYNNYGDIDTLLNDWFTFLNTGLIVTGTGVSDTHTKVATSAGVPRTFTKMPTDTPSRMNDHDLVANVNTQKVVVSNGPFLIVEVENSAGQTAGSGDLLYSNGNDINLKIRIQSPTWIKYDAIKIFSNTGETATGDDGTLNSRSPAPIKEYKLGTDFALDSSAEVVADGGRRYEVNIAGKFSISRDAWFIVQVKTESEEYGLFPLSFNNGEKPLSISNPVFVTVENDNDFDPPGATRRTGLSGAATKNTIQQLRASTIEEIGRLSKIIDKKK